jgi:hypothetical protein
MELYWAGRAILHMPSRLDSLIAEGLARLEELLGGAGLGSKPVGAVEVPGAAAEGSGSRALRVRAEGLGYLVLLQGVVGNPSFESLRRALGEGVLTARVAAAERGLVALPVVVGTPITARMAGRLAEYHDWSDPGGSWGMLDPAGGAWIQIGARRIEVAEPPRSRMEAAERVVTPFTDQGQWLLKVLLAPRIEERLLNAPRLRAGSDADLAKAAQVSTSTVSRLLAGLESLGYLDRYVEGHRLIRLPELLAAWSSAAASTVRERGARFRLPGGEPLQRLRAALERAQKNATLDQSPRACLALFAACRQLGIGHVAGAPVHLYHEDPSPSALEALGLRATGPQERPKVWIRRPPYPEAVFRAAPLIEGVPTADALQCWLDVSNHPLRGAEQAEELMARLGLLRQESL